MGLLNRWVGVREGEVWALVWAFLYFFSLLAAYYVVRPLRDEMGIEGGVENLPWMFTATFLAMLAAVPLYGAASSRFPRRRLVPGVYLFFLANLLAFYAAFRIAEDPAWVARVFFVWVSVFNLFVVSVFWTFMDDLFTNEQGRRLFGAVAAGGSAGAVAGPALTTGLVQVLGTHELVLVSAALLAFTLLCISRLLAQASRLRAEGKAEEAGEGAGQEEVERGLGGGAWAGVRLLARSPYLLGVAGYILLYTATSTFLYFLQAHIVEDNLADPDARTTLFAAMDLAVNLLTVGTQLFVTGRVLARLGVGVGLALLPGVVAAGFAVLAFAPVLGVLVVFQVLRRASNYALARPAREVLFTVVGREARYKAKNVIDTVAYRGGDAATGWAFAGLTGLGLGLAGVAAVAVPLALVWLGLGLALGRRQEALRSESHPAAEQGGQG
ncbi:MFS transporter [Thiohalorhabdus denitrificans]|uniref:ATP:ADP antiporter, AAA family n=2 Tax=Thiohalorhabdus denitrificans TaxID=381306 RepID=A0A0P9EKI9_9GAMM|nr:MFS transporter [Thiohalorhabdus denitrificans]SCX78084.1 ATP:ADP antiporter, AAA family [Thiohalorhabdus denitrificans]